MSARKSYLGDGVYVDLENGMVKLTTEEGSKVTNVVYLEHEVLKALEQYVRCLRIEAADMIDVALRGDP